MREELIMPRMAELNVDNVRPIPFPEPPRVYVWIRHHSAAIRVHGHAAKIRSFNPLIMILREGWVWLGAIAPFPRTDHHFYAADLFNCPQKCVAVEDPLAGTIYAAGSFLEDSDIGWI
ncbi:hypothetical protein [Arthrobacter sp. H20]|uniref:hypothetical protein n=1 Tax=Arthrobacter sp. H20 TaxID=1267981 RepID=UPI00047CA8B1|nr:hypothetical protein [Arthrobacter sp. H20]